MDANYLSPLQHSIISILKGFKKFLLNTANNISFGNPGSERTRFSSCPPNNGMLRHSFLRVGEDIPSQHILLPQCPSSS